MLTALLGWGGDTEALLTSPAAPAGNSAAVTAWLGCSRGGHTSSFKVGSYNFADITAHGLTYGSTSMISDFHIPAGLSVTVYTGDHLGGESTTFTAPETTNACMIAEVGGLVTPGGNWNYRIMSLTVNQLP